MSYYKTNDQAVLDAVKRHRTERNAVYAAAKQFAEQFDGKPIITRDFTHIAFLGVEFNPRKPTTVWTTPDKFYAQRPRARVGRGATEADKQELKQLVETWKIGYPMQRAELDVLYKAIGVNWGDILFSGIGYFEGVDGFFYVETSMKLGHPLQEILGSEFMLAKEATKEARA